MDRSLIPATAAATRAAIAHAVLRSTATDLGGAGAGHAQLGDVTLRPHQVDAVGRLRSALRYDGGALLADGVGLGKTYVALALAQDAACPLVVAPAVLRDMWRRAMDATGVRAPFVSFEALSRGRGEAHAVGVALPSGARRPAAAARHDLVVVDEAHYARNPSTRRYRALAALTVGARVLLLSATPIHNRRADLCALLALFLGARALALDDRMAARFVVRRDRAALSSSRDAPSSGMPEVAPPELLHIPADDAIADAILALPPPLPPSGGGDGGALLGHLLVRQWASSDAALRAALRRRLARARAIASSLDRGVYPSRAELLAWTSDGASQQLAFAELLAPAERRERPDIDQLRETVVAHVDAVRGLLATSGASGDSSDDARAALLARLCDRHRGERVVAFSSFSETVEAMFLRLRSRRRAAVLTSAGAAVAGGPLSRREAIARFAPLGSGAKPPRDAERVDLLLTTDLLSEGVSLADASVVVHLDLPWTPARLEQRVGRAARLGAPHRRVAVYAVAPPASAEGILRIEQTLREKLRVAGRAVGLAGAILPGPALDTPGDAAESASQHGEAVRRVLASWCGEGTGVADHPVGAVRASSPGFVAACRPARAADAPPILLVALEAAGEATDDPRLVRRALETATGAEGVSLSAGALSDALAAVGRWSARRLAASTAGIEDGAAARARRRVIQRIAVITRHVPPHRRAIIAPLALGARRAALVPCGAGGEWVLEQLARAELPDEAWLRAVRAFGESAPPHAERGADTALDVVALLLLQPG